MSECSYWWHREIACDIKRCAHIGDYYLDEDTLLGVVDLYLCYDNGSDEANDHVLESWNERINTGETKDEAWARLEAKMLELAAVAVQPERSGRI